MVEEGKPAPDFELTSDSGEQVKRRLLINQKAIKGLNEPWRVPEDLLREADIVVDDAGVHRKEEKAP